jgi:D-lyxose ketol-isomerase
VAEMKRSQINRAIKEMEALINKYSFALPTFCHWTPEDWESKGHEYDEIRDNMLGWDVTDYGEGRFDELGFTLITIRNGNVKMKNKYKKTYAEKLLMLKEDQYSPMHFHWEKMEDIINRGGGNVLITVYNSTTSDKFADTEVKISSDGREYYVPAGSKIRLTPGESITIYPYMYHDFEVEKGTGPVLLGEVSMCNDDKNDNRFYEDFGRFPTIEEDEKPYRLLCFEYPKAK